MELNHTEILKTETKKNILYQLKMQENHIENAKKDNTYILDLENILLHNKNIKQRINEIETFDNELDLILGRVSELTEIDINLLKSKKRNRHLIDAKAAFCQIARKDTASSLQVIGETIGIDNHATIIYHLKKDFKEINNIKNKYYENYS